LHPPYWCIWSVPPSGERETALPKGKDLFRPLACSDRVLSGQGLVMVYGYGVRGVRVRGARLGLGLVVTVSGWWSGLGF
jgi:hypothetical protein